ncbi:MAG: polysaccharide biosynthesis C-terminal domain-containing protein [Metallosphaera sp.]|uniref:polysaccharide biosynthesis C-terminal domain-containing protein n=1 Tax=Metallosphaera sp. TaxID=2020860 RepID=UPI00316E9B62
MKILVLFITVTMPFQILSTFLIALNKNYRPFLVIGSASAIEVVLVSFLLIPRMGILGAGIAQAGNAIVTSILYVIFSLKQGIITLDRKTIYSILLISLSSISLFSWVIGALVIILGLKFLGIITNKEMALIQKFIPPQLRFFIRILNLFI